MIHRYWDKNLPDYDDNPTKKPADGIEVARMTQQP